MAHTNVGFYKSDLFPPTMMRIQGEWRLYAFREVTMSSDGGRGGQSQPIKHTNVVQREMYP